MHSIFTQQSQFISIVSSDAEIKKKKKQKKISTIYFW